MRVALYVRQRGIQQGFTLIEILLVIAIIGMLASVVLVGLSGPRARSHESKTLASARSAQMVAIVCMDDRSDLFEPGTSPPATDYVCDATTQVWPRPLGDGWGYGDAGACAFDGDVTDYEFRFCVHNTANTQVMACDSTGCTTDDIP